MSPGLNCVWSGPRPTVTSASHRFGHFEHRDAVLVARKVLVADGGLDLLGVEDRRHARSLPESTIHLPFGATSTPCGDLPQGRSSTNPGTFFGSSTFTPTASAFPSLTPFLCCCLPPLMVARSCLPRLSAAGALGVVGGRTPSRPIRSCRRPRGQNRSGAP